MKKSFFAKHAKSSAALASLGLHVILLVVALSFVAVSVIQKQEAAFEAKQVNRPKMQLKKLQVPVNIKKRAPKPKLRKRIVVQPRLSRNLPDIKLPEISVTRYKADRSDFKYEMRRAVSEIVEEIIEKQLNDF